MNKTTYMSVGAMASGAAAEFMTRNTQAYNMGGATASVVTDEDRKKLAGGAKQ